MTFYCSCLHTDISSLTLIQHEFICWCRIISHIYTANYFILPMAADLTLKVCGAQTWRCVVGAGWRRSNGFVTHGDVSRQLPVRRATSFGHVNPVLIQFYWWWWAPKSWGKGGTDTHTHTRKGQHVTFCITGILAAGCQQGYKLWMFFITWYTNAVSVKIMTWMLLSIRRDFQICRWPTASHVSSSGM